MTTTSIPTTHIKNCQKLPSEFRLPNDPQCGLYGSPDWIGDVVLSAFGEAIPWGIGHALHKVSNFGIVITADQSGVKFHLPAANISVRAADLKNCRIFMNDILARHNFPGCEIEWDERFANLLAWCVCWANLTSGATLPGLTDSLVSDRLLYHAGKLDRTYGITLLRNAVQRAEGENRADGGACFFWHHLGKLDALDANQAPTGS